ncbi:PDZ domain-containing protein [Lewinella sp. LCG006]|uniref:S41 family peptidase n=1 Tax=Lewinella sp. LCG006 TaxID=3231911 RepID=UPI003461143B
MKLLYSLLFALSFCTLAGQGTQLLRQPTLSRNHVVFVYANDLWKADRSGGTAVRLTTHEGYESLPHFSPDEQWIAFTAAYDGNTDVYVIPAEGGTPQRLTWHPDGDFVTGWTPDGQVLFRSGREGRPTQTNKLYSVSLKGGLPVALDIPRAAYGEISANGQYLAYVPITSWDPEWRNYRGGQAMPIWIVDLKTKALTRTPQPTQERHLDPVWWEGKIYYLSERDLASNIWMYDPANGNEEQVTFHKKFDVKSLDAGPDALVYEQGGYLHVLDPTTKKSTQIAIEVKGDQNFARPRWEDISARDWDNPQLSPTGQRVILEHRGEIFTVPKEKGSWRNLTNNSGAADRNPIWSPKGDQVAWFSDVSGEYQLQLADQQGKLIKTYALPNPTFYFRPAWSPDGRYIAYTDTDYNIWCLDLTTGNTKLADTDRYAHPNRAMNPVWSPDSKWLAYAKQLESHFKVAFAFQVETGERIQLTDGMADVISPVWDKGGKYLYFLASTDYGLNSGWLDMSSFDPAISRSLYCLVLSAKAEGPTLVESDEEPVGPKEEEEEEKSKDEAITVNIDPQGLFGRTVALNVPSGNYMGLEAGLANEVFLLESVPKTPGATVHKYKLEDHKKEEFLTGVRNFITSNDGAHLLYQTSNWHIVATKSTPKAGDGKLDADLKIAVDPQAEYHQIFKEGWRYMRDFLYVDNVHGAPWDKVYEWYAPWIDHVRHRTDLNYVVDIMSGEVAIGHSYVSGGDFPDTDRVPVGLLGCDFREQNGYYQIAKIYTGEQWNPDVKAPLHLPGLNVKEGDYLLAVNGKSLSAPTNPYQLFEQTSDRAITITVASSPDGADRRELLVKPVANERDLRYWDWIEGNRRKVDELSDGKLAYVYVPNTGNGGFTSFNRYYFAQQDKKGVIIDERNNGGGSAADYMIDVMSRTLFGFFNSKANDRRPWTTPMAGIWGPKVMLINERAGSGGDLLPYMFKAKGIGPLVGTRTWGGLVGTWDTPRFVDGGRMVAPRGGFFDTNGNWAVEGEGVAPDIEVIQDPKLVLEGHDPQLERAVSEALRMLEEETFELPNEPKAPVRWKRPEGFKE